MGPATTNCSGKVDRATALATCEGMMKLLARRYAGADRTLQEDLEQEARIALIYAADHFNPNLGVKFVTYATHHILGHIQHHVRDKSRTIRLPGWLQEHLSQINRASIRLEWETGRKPKAAEIADRIGLTAAVVETVLAADERAKIASLDFIAGDEFRSLDLERLLLETELREKMPSEDRLFIEEAIALLPRLQRQVISLYFYRDLTQAEIGRELGRSQNYISYLLRRALSALRARGEACMEEMP